VARRIAAPEEEAIDGTLDEVDPKTRFIWLWAYVFTARSQSSTHGVTVTEDFLDRFRDLADRIYNAHDSKKWEERFGRLFALARSEGYGDGALASLERLAAEAPATLRGHQLERRVRLSGGHL
jgi:MoxR-like ATPase